MNSGTVQPAGRLRIIDATRGVAMLLVCTAHVCDAWYGTAGDWMNPVRLVSQKLTMMASPTFMVISGTMLGYLNTVPDRLRLRAKLIDRAIFLLIVAHPLIALFQEPMFGALRPSFMRLAITDTIALSILAASALVHLPRRVRLTLAAALFTAAWTIVVFSRHSRMPVVRILFGSEYSTGEAYSFPFVPWFALYLVGTCVGEKLGSIASSPAQVARLFAKVGGVLVAAGLALGGLWGLRLKALSQRGDEVAAWVKALAPFGKWPPALGYLTLYAGGGLLLATAITLLANRGIAAAVIAQFARIGRNSLFTFVLQFFVYHTCVALLPIPRTIPIAVVALASFAVIWATVRAWDARDLSRKVLTVGYPWVRRPVAVEVTR